MHLFGFMKKREPPVYTALCLTSHAMKAIVFEVPNAGELPRVLKTFIFKIPYTSGIAGSSSPASLRFVEERMDN